MNMEICSVCHDGFQLFPAFVHPYTQGRILTESAVWQIWAFWNFIIFHPHHHCSDVCNNCKERSFLSFKKQTESHVTSTNVIISNTPVKVQKSDNVNKREVKVVVAVATLDWELKKLPKITMFWYFHKHAINLCYSHVSINSLCLHFNCSHYNYDKYPLVVSLKCTHYLFHHWTTQTINYLGQ